MEGICARFLHPGLRVRLFIFESTTATSPRARNEAIEGQLETAERKASCNAFGSTSAMCLRTSSYGMSG